MDRDTLFIVISIVCIANGILSPVIIIPYALSPIWMPDFIPITAATAAYGASLMVSLATLVLSGVPAALYERLGGRGGSGSMLIWLGGAVLLSLPAVQHIAGR